MKNLSLYGLISVLLVAILLGWYSSSLSDDLKAAKKDNKELASDVKDRDKTIADLKGAADADRRATEQQLKLEQLKREKADVENGKLRRALEDSDCSNQRLPDSAIDILRRSTKASTTSSAIDLHVPPSGATSAV